MKLLLKAPVIILAATLLLAVATPDHGFNYYHDDPVGITTLSIHCHAISPLLRSVVSRLLRSVETYAEYKPRPHHLLLPGEQIPYHTLTIVLTTLTYRGPPRA